MNAIRRSIGALGLITAFVVCIGAQEATAPVPVSQEPHHHLILENDYVRVYSVEVPPGGETLVHQHAADYLSISVGGSDIENDVVGKPPVRAQLKDEDTRFVKGGFAHKVVNKSDKPFRNLTIELKKPGEQPTS